SSTEAISSPTVSLQICFPHNDFKFKTEAKLIWMRDLESGASLYGVEFVGLGEKERAELRKELIKIQTESLLREIEDRGMRKMVSDFFLSYLSHYINEIIKVTQHLFKGKEYSEEIERRLNQLHTQILLKGHCLEKLFSESKVMQKIKDNFRHLISTWIYKSTIVKYAFEKPRGYAGDYKMLEIIYDNKPISKNMGVYFDNNFLKSPYAVAVRIRKDHLREILQRFFNETKLNKLNILNIACGSCREIRELLPSLKTKSSIIFNCLDWDEEALKFSQGMLLPIKPKNVEFKFIKEDIMNIIKNESTALSLGKQDLIYSIGLIDYLPDRVLKKLIYVLYQLLQKNGRLILTHKNREKTFPPIPPDWFCDWKFVPRNKEEVIELFYACGISEFSLSIDSDDFEYIHYFTVIKR
ncbi:MAG: class I SAM-dependent methyltransferase family protein, partial [Candidatus Omnitrophica bacterium]|nr:class I SAM-dependent methyltransferase family protein [Candidatus Omnitrophota bacterium]